MKKKRKVCNFALVTFRVPLVDCELFVEPNLGSMFGRSMGLQTCVQRVASRHDRRSVIAIVQLIIPS
jgi:hypothetical protein